MQQGIRQGPKFRRGPGIVSLSLAVSHTIENSPNTRTCDRREHTTEIWEVGLNTFLHHISLHYVTLHCITLHFITKHRKYRIWSLGRLARGHSMLRTASNTGERVSICRRGCMRLSMHVCMYEYISIHLCVSMHVRVYAGR